jgi:hypothetical protein
MNNHYHLLVRCSEEPLGILMRRLNSKYARYFSIKYNSRGAEIVPGWEKGG